MKKTVIALILASGIGYIAYASLGNHRSQNQAMEKKTEKQENKKECKHHCPFS